MFDNISAIIDKTKINSSTMVFKGLNLAEQSLVTIQYTLIYCLLKFDGNMKRVMYMHTLVYQDVQQ